MFIFRRCVRFDLFKHSYKNFKHESVEKCGQQHCHPCTELNESVLCNTDCHYFEISKMFIHAFHNKIPHNYLMYLGALRQPWHQMGSLRNYKQTLSRHLSFFAYVFFYLLKEVYLSILLLCIVFRAAMDFKPVKPKHCRAGQNIEQKLRGSCCIIGVRTYKYKS